MQETPEFPQYQSRFQAFNEDALINNQPAITDTQHIATIRRAFEVIGQYFSDVAFRETLTIARKRNIESQINAVLSQFDQIVSLRANGQMPGNLEGSINNIQANMDEIDLRFTTPYETYLLSNKRSAAKTAAALDAAEVKASRAADKLEAKLAEVDLLVGQGTDIEFANFFQRLANGMTVAKNEELMAKPKMSSKELAKRYAIFGAVFALVLGLGANEIMTLWQDDHDLRAYLRIAAFLSIPAIAVTAWLHSWLNETRPGGYERAAAIWVVAATLTVLGTGIYAAAVIAGLGPDPGWNELVPKIVSLLAPAYMLRLCVRNFRANQHLAVANTHRAVVSRAVSGFAGRLESAEPSLLSDANRFKGDMFLKAAGLIFDPGESGFISRSEGAGTSDNFFDDSMSKMPTPK